MELFARLENISLHIRMLKQRCSELQAANESLQKENEQLKINIKNTSEELENLAETNKIAKLAQTYSSNIDTAADKTQLDELIRDIDDCIKFIKQ